MAAVFPRLRGLWQMSPRLSLIAEAGGVIYVTGAAVLESVGYGMLSAGSTLSSYRAEVAAEEFFEMMGASVILYAVLLLCCVTKKKRAWRVTTSPRVAFGAHL